MLSEVDLEGGEECRRLLRTEVGVELIEHVLAMVSGEQNEHVPIAQTARPKPPDDLGVLEGG